MAAVIKVLKDILKTSSEFLRAVFLNKGIYKYSFSDLWHGAWLLRCGYTRKVAPEKILDDNDGKFIRVDVGGQQVTVLKDVFKPRELYHLYQETFGGYPGNPHSYLKGCVAIRPGDVVIDAGACEGFFVKLALGARCEYVYAFEPLGVLTQGLIRTFDGNNRVEILSCGLSDGDGRGKISSDVEYVCETKINKDGSEEVSLTTIDAFVKARGLPRVGFIKMDIEGAEYGILKNSKAIPKAERLIIELHGTRKELPEMSEIIASNMSHVKRVKDSDVYICRK